MKNYKGSAEGLRIIFKAVIGMLICAFALLLPLIGILGLIGLIVAEVMFLVGFYRTGKDIPACKVAFVLQIISIAVTVVEIFVSLPDIVSLVSGVLPIVANLILIIAVTKVVKERGAVSVARLGIITVCFYIGAMVGAVVLTVLFVVLAFMDFSGAAIFLLIAIVALAITSLVLYLKFLRNSAEQLGASV